MNIDLVGAKVIKVEGNPDCFTGIEFEKDNKKYCLYPLDAYDGWGMCCYEVTE